MTSWRDLLAQLSMMLDRAPRLTVAVYAAVIGGIFAVMVLGHAARIEYELGLFRALMYLAGVSGLCGVAAWKALRRRR